MTAGYSGTPLAKKLGLKPGQRVWRSGMPATVVREIDAEAGPIDLVEEPVDGIDVAHVFTRSRAELTAALALLRTRIAPDGMIWISWPKKASGVSTDITEDVIREIALPIGLVDIKVCAVDEIWSGLKLVIRKQLR
jgi:hypothetical protein